MLRMYTHEDEVNNLHTFQKVFARSEGSENIQIKTLFRG